MLCFFIPLKITTIENLIDPRGKKQIPTAAAIKRSTSFYATSATPEGNQGQIHIEPRHHSKSFSSQSAMEKRVVGMAKAKRARLIRVWNRACFPKETAPVLTQVCGSLLQSVNGERCGCGRRSVHF